MKRRPNGVALACLVLVALIITLALTATRGSSGIPLASDNPGPSGAQALAKVLENHGASVRTARTPDDIDRPVSADTTVFVAGDATLDADARSRLLDAVHGAGRLVVVEPTPDMRTQLFPPSGDSGVGGDGVAPDVEFGRAHGGTTPVAVNDSTIFTNATIASGNNAASALRLLGATRDVLWIADWQGSTSRASDEQGLAWPDWKGPLTWALACTVGVLALARGRRFGPLVTEPLPVVVPASESTRALATLFRRSTTREWPLTPCDAGARPVSRHVWDSAPDTRVPTTSPAPCAVTIRSSERRAASARSGPRNSPITSPGRFPRPTANSSTSPPLCSSSRRR